MKWKKIINVTLSCPCAHYEDIWERGGTTPHIINPVLLHTMPSHNILVTTVSMLTFLPLHNISLAIKLNSWLFHSLHILVSIFLWVMIFGQTYQHSLALSGTLVKLVWNLMAHSDAREGKWRMEWVASTLTLPWNMVYPALLMLMRTPRLPAVDWTDSPTNLNGLVSFGERRTLVSARVPTRSTQAILHECVWSASHYTCFTL